MIVVEGLSKIYPVGGQPFYALREVSMTVADGEMVAIMGKSGAGKSTLLHVLGCMESFEEGRYTLDGQDVSALSARRLARLRNEKLGFVMQDYSLLNQRSVLFKTEHGEKRCGAHGRRSSEALFLCPDAAGDPQFYA